MADPYAPFARIYDVATAWALAGVRRRVARRLAELEPARVLDVGCGTGMQFLHLDRTDGVPALLGVDASAAMLARTRKHRVPGVLYARADATRLPLPGGSFDAVLMALALHENPAHTCDAMLNEALRVLAPHGLLLVTDYLRPRTVSDRMAHALLSPVERLAGRGHYRGYVDFLSKGGVEGLCLRHGLSVHRLDRHLLGTLGVLEARREGCANMYTTMD